MNEAHPDQYLNQQLNQQPNQQRAPKLTFSVALCTYQGGQFLHEQLQSILDQTVLPDEIVIRDDGSTDATLAICREFQAKSQVPVRILPSDRQLGVAGNFFTCAKACQSDIILFCDQDDVWLPERIARFRAAFQEFPEAHAILSDALIVDEKLQPTGQMLWSSHFFTAAEQKIVQQGRAVDILARHVFVTGSALAIQHAWLDAVPEPSHDFYHDEWLGWFAGPALRLLPEPTFQYRQHQRQQTGVDTTWLAKLKHLRSSQAESRNLLLRDSRRFASLAACLDLSGYTERGKIVRAKIEFVNWRLNLSPFFPVRLIQVLAKVVQGDYTRFSILNRSVIKDLFFYTKET